MATARVGIFFKVTDGWVIDAVDLDQGEEYGGAIQHGGHYEHWAAANPATVVLRAFTAHDYDYFPRGRVVFLTRQGVFRIYLDNCLTPSDRERVVSQFNLASQPFEIEGNDDGIHYVCAGCSPGYLE